MLPSEFDWQLFVTSTESIGGIPPCDIQRVAIFCPVDGKDCGNNCCLLKCRAVMYGQGTVSVTEPVDVTGVVAAR